jgi:DNA-binding transcriptional LysR family regulator
MGNGIGRIERRVKLHDLRVLMSVVERGSMAKAAESLATSQPAISRSIADLELCLGVRLLDRGPRGVAPTPYGRALIRRGIAIFDELKQSVQDIESLADPTAGEVRIAAPIGWGAGFVAAVIDRLARHYPRIVCHLTICDTTAPVLEQREVDLVVTRPFTIPPPEDHFQGELLFAESSFVIAGIKNPWARRRRIKLADLINEPWALPPLMLACTGTWERGKGDIPTVTSITVDFTARKVRGGGFQLGAPLEITSLDDVKIHFRGTRAFEGYWSMTLDGEEMRAVENSGKSGEIPQNRDILVKMQAKATNLKMGDDVFGHSAFWPRADFLDHVRYFHSLGLTGRSGLCLVSSKMTHSGQKSFAS